MFIRIKGVILNTDKIEVVMKCIESLRYVVICNERIIFSAKTKEERDDFFDNLWQEIEKRNFSAKKEGKENV